MSKHRILSFGELMLRLSSTGMSFLEKGSPGVVFPAGSEANVVASLAQWNVPCSYLSRMPDNELAAQALDVLKELGVDVSPTLLERGRLGLYFLLSANGLTKGEVVYDRKYSAFSQLQPGTGDWHQMHDGCSCVLWTAITPALQEARGAMCKGELEAARRKGLVVSVYPNYRNELW